MILADIFEQMIILRYHIYGWTNDWQWQIMETEYLKEQSINRGILVHSYILLASLAIGSTYISATTWPVKYNSMEPSLGRPNHIRTPGK